MAESKIETGMPSRAARSTTLARRACHTGARHDPAEAPVDRGLDNFDLAAGIDFERRRVPFDGEVKLAAGFDGAGVHGLPEDVVRVLW